MTSIAGALLFLAASPIAGVPLPPDGAVDQVFTEIYSSRAAAETKAALEQLEADASRPSAEKKEIRKRLAKLRVVVLTTPRTLDEAVAFYEREVKDARFLFAVRNLEADLAEGIRTGAIKGDPSVVPKAAGQRGRSARWNRADGALEIAIEDHLLDPRTGEIVTKTIVLVTSLGD
jgi:hypothetical protein